MFKAGMKIKRRGVYYLYGDGIAGGSDVEKNSRDFSD